jgi:hypothetical protein
LRAYDDVTSLRKHYSAHPMLCLLNVLQRLVRLLRTPCQYCRGQNGERQVDEQRAHSRDEEKDIFIPHFID